MLRDLTITGGTGTDDQAGSVLGGGIYAPGANPTLINCQVVGNHISDDGIWKAAGGGIYQVGPGMTLIGCRVTDNTAYGEFGGYASGGGAAISSDSVIINCEFTRNHAYAEFFFVDGKVFGGYALGGGVIFTGGAGAGVMLNCTVADNTATGYPLYAHPAGLAGRTDHSERGLIVANCIIVNNLGNDSVDNLSGSMPISYSCVNGEGAPGEGNINANPQFINPVPQAFDYRLHESSPCRDAGSNDALPPDAFDLDGDGNTSEQLSRDLDLLRRKVNGIVDMGAYEWQHACASDIAPSSPGIAGDGVVDVDDLVAVILGWGACDQCVADINGDDVVDVDDLVLVILNWGPCS